MTEENFTVQFEEDPIGNYTRVPNIVDEMGLDPFAFRLYFHLRKVAGEDGKSWKSTTTLADDACMSAGSVHKAKRELVKVGLIRVELKPGKHGGLDYHEITIVNIWKKNREYFEQKKRSSSPDEVANSPHEVANSPHEPINNPLNNNPNNNPSYEGASLQDADGAGESPVSDPAIPEPQTKSKREKKPKAPKKDGYFRMEWVKTLPDNQQDFVRYALSVFHGHGPKWQSTMEKAIKEIFLPYGLNKSIACLMYYKEAGKDFTTAVNHAAKYIANWRWNPNDLSTLPTLDKTAASPAPAQQTFIAPDGGFYV